MGAAPWAHIDTCPRAGVLALPVQKMSFFTFLPTQGSASGSGMTREKHVPSSNSDSDERASGLRSSDLGVAMMSGLR